MTRRSSNSGVQIVRAVFAKLVEEFARQRALDSEEKSVIQQGTTTLVPHVPAALGGEVEELAGAVGECALALNSSFLQMRCDACDKYLQLGLDTNGLASGINVGGGEGGSGEVGVAAAHGVGGGGTCDDEAGEDGSGTCDGRHFGGCVVGCVV